VPPVDSLQEQEGRVVPGAPLIRFARQVEVREGAVDMRLDDLARRPDIGFIELPIAGDAE